MGQKGTKGMPEVNQTSIKIRPMVDTRKRKKKGPPGIYLWTHVGDIFHLRYVQNHCKNRCRVSGMYVFDMFEIRFRFVLDMCLAM